MVLARVPKGRIIEREAYDFYAGLDDDANRAGRSGSQTARPC